MAVTVRRHTREMVESLCNIDSPFCFAKAAQVLLDATEPSPAPRDELSRQIVHIADPVALAAEWRLLGDSLRYLAYDQEAPF